MSNSDWFDRLMAYDVIRHLPDHLKQYIVDQNYTGYTPVDHAVWRYVLRQSRNFLKDHAHKIYLNGLKQTGLQVEKIPSIEDMNDILSKIGWAAVPVDGFIPPAAFMEFQAYRVLVIAADMRQLHHIEYTPSPDIIHEAAGHAPIIADPLYAEYLRLFGEVGAKAMSSNQDFQLYEAIRKLSILKESPDALQEEIDAAEKDVLLKQENLGEPSEMALLSRLHWWTVEYGLVGDMDNSKIYGAGLLSSIGESVSCLQENVKKIPYSPDAVNYAFDITTKQPQLFVTPDFRYLIDVLKEFARNMAFKRGGISGINKAVQCGNTSTIVYRSGLQVSGTFTDVIADAWNRPVYVNTSGPSNLSFAGKQLDGHGKDYHKEGFSSPIGLLDDSLIALEDMTDAQLKENQIIVGESVTLNFESGVRVKGLLRSVLRREERIILMSFVDCRVTLGERILFEPSWGVYDMAVGEKIVSVFSGAADKDAFDQPSKVSRTRTIKVSYDDSKKALHELYGRVRRYRNGDGPDSLLSEVLERLNHEFREDWLLRLEVLEIYEKESREPVQQKQIRAYLKQLAAENHEYTKLINDGLNLLHGGKE